MNEFTEDQQALYDLMSDLSEEYYFAGWILGCEYWLWKELSSNERNMYSITVEQKQALALAVDKAGGWIIWDDDANDPEFLTIDDWKNKVKL